MTSYRESLSHISFTALEFHRDGRFRPACYEYRGDASRGWEILREHAPYLRLGPGFTALQTRYCGICSTDIARAALPFPLPQITGHEVVGVRDGRALAVDINASHRARAHQADDCPWCAGGLETHCPQRLTLGIDRLPGGFAPWILAPVAALYPVPSSVTIEAAVFAEPFAAALRAVEVTPPRPGDRVAVLGPRRLGLLVLAALASHRRRYDRDYSITALHRHGWLSGHCLRLGADEALHVDEIPAATRQGGYDIVFDTTGSPDGMRQALRLARRVLHLKSTHGREAERMTRLTEMVIDEITLLPFSATTAPPAMIMKYGEQAGHVHVSPSVPEPLQRHLQSLLPRCRFYRTDMAGWQGVAEFDLALVGGLEEADAVIRPQSAASRSLLRARGILLVAAPAAPGGSALAQALARGVEIHTSRCGRIPRALDTLAAQPDLARVMAEDLVTHCYPVKDLARAFAMAEQGRGTIKVLVDTWRGQ